MTQITETTNEGLKRSLKVVIEKDELAGRFDARLGQIKNQVQIKGFRKGKVPTSHLKRLYGRSLMAEILQQAVEETSTKALADRKERPAMQPKIDLTEDESEIEAVMSGNADLAYSMSFEIIPDFTLADLSGLSLARHVAEVEDGELEKALDDIAERATNFEPVEGRPAEEGDRLLIDYVGKIDGEAFDGGTGEGSHIVIGQGGFIPGFEDGLKGAKPGDERILEVTFPEDYQAKELAGKDATFDVAIKEVAKPVKPAIDDELAKSLGAENLEKLKELVKSQYADEYAAMTRARLKRDLLDQLDKAHEFELPASLVDSEFDGMWKQVTSAMERAGKSFEDEGKSEEEAKRDYRKIAERRVRLGLVIGEIGEKNQIKTTKEELQRAVAEQTRQYPGQEKSIIEFYAKNPGALNQLRAPIYEDKVVDFVLALAKIEEKKIAIEDLKKALEDEDDGDGDPAALAGGA